MLSLRAPASRSLAAVARSTSPCVLGRGAARRRTPARSPVARGRETARAPRAPRRRLQDLRSASRPYRYVWDHLRLEHSWLSSAVYVPLTLAVFMSRCHVRPAEMDRAAYEKA